MADELFDGNIASEMSLGEAIVRGILAPPKYVLSTFSCQKDLEKYKKRVSRAKSKIVREEGEKYLDALKRALDKADGLDEIFNKHMTERTGKYIIFCSDYEHMCQMKELAGEWFYKVDKSPHIYSMYSEDPASDKEFAAFKADNDNTHLRLLYCIDALNEGVHVDDISGVILLRPTVSPIIYKQQIGRALQTGIKQSSVIFDIVMNIENLYSIGTVEEEMRLAVSYYRSHGLESNIINEHFRVIDEVKECLSLFDKLNETLTASWDFMYAEAKKYYEQNGNIEIPKRYKTPNGYSLGTWILTQKRVYNGLVGGILTEERIDKLNAIGMVWESHRDMLWQRYFDAATEYSKIYGNLDIPALYITDDGLKLGNWIANLRTSRKNGFDSKYLTSERIKALDEIGMIWKVADYMWQQYYGACLMYYGTNGNLDIPYRYVTGDGLKLGYWLNNIRTAYKKGESRISQEQISQLNELGMVWNKEKSWDIRFALAKAYFDENGNLNMSTNYVVNGIWIGKWLSEQRKKYKSGKLPVEHMRQLETLNIDWTANIQKKYDEIWLGYFKKVKVYFDKYGNISDIGNSLSEKDKKLDIWLSKQRQCYKEAKLSDEKIKLLESVGIVWNTYADAWETGFLHAKNIMKQTETLILRFPM